MSLTACKYRIKDEPFQMVEMKILVSINTHASIGKTIFCTRNTSQNPVIPKIVRQCRENPISIASVVFESPIDDGDSTRHPKPKY